MISVLPIFPSLREYFSFRKIMHLGSPIEIHQTASFIIKKAPRGEDQQLSRPVKWKSIQYMYKKRLSYLPHKAYYKNCPEHIKNVMEKCANNTRNMRDNIKLRVNRPNTELGRTQFSYRAAIGWNCLPGALRRIQNYKIVKEQLGLSSTVIEQISFNKLHSLAIRTLATINILK